jgi:hypothetical protein
MSVIWVGQCTTSDISHQAKKWLERCFLSRWLHRMPSTQHPLSSSFLPAKGLQASRIYKSSLQEDGDQCEPRTWWSLTYRDWNFDSSKVVLRRREWVRSLVVRRLGALAKPDGTNSLESSYASLLVPALLELLVDEASTTWICNNQGQCLSVVFHYTEEDPHFCLI